MKQKLTPARQPIDALRQTVSEKEEIISNQRHEIQSLKDVIGERDKEQDGLNGRNRELKEQVNTHKATIGTLRRTLSKKEEIISNQLQNINTYSKIRDIAVKAAGTDLEFKTLKIDEYLPINREEWLETRLNQALGRRNVGLYNLIDNHIDFDEDLNRDELDYSDYDLAHVIKTQRNVLAHPEKMKKETGMAGYFAASLQLHCYLQNDQNRNNPLLNITDGTYTVECSKPCRSAIHRLTTKMLTPNESGTCSQSVGS